MNSKIIYRNNDVINQVSVSPSEPSRSATTTITNTNEVYTHITYLVGDAKATQERTDPLSSHPTDHPLLNPRIYCLRNRER